MGGFASRSSKAKKAAPVEETPAKAVRGFWASFSSSATTKTKSKEEKPRGGEDLLIDMDEVAEAPSAPLVDDIAASAAPPPKATSKATKPGRLSVAERIEALERSKREKAKEKPEKRKRQIILSTISLSTMRVTANKD